MTISWAKIYSHENCFILNISNLQIFTGAYSHIPAHTILIYANIHTDMHQESGVLDMPMFKDKAGFKHKITK